MPLAAHAVDQSWPVPRRRPEQGRRHGEPQPQRGERNGNAVAASSVAVGAAKPEARPELVHINIGHIHATSTRAKQHQQQWPSQQPGGGSSGWTSRSGSAAQQPQRPSAGGQRLAQRRKGKDAKDAQSWGELTSPEAKAGTEPF